MSHGSTNFILYRFITRSALLKLVTRGTNGPVNAHLISGPSMSKKHTKPGKKRSRNDLDLQYSLSFTELSASKKFQATGCNSF